MAPSRRTLTPALLDVTTVDSTSVEREPPFSTTSTLPSNSVKASFACLSDGVPEIFALVPMRDPPDLEIKSNVSPRPGTLRAVICLLPITWIGKSAMAAHTIVNGPGQNRDTPVSDQPRVSA